MTPKKKVIRNADLRHIKLGIEQGLSLSELSDKMNIEEELLAAHYPKPKKKAAKKPVVKNDADSDEYMQSSVG